MALTSPCLGNVKWTSKGSHQEKLSKFLKVNRIRQSYNTKWGRQQLVDCSDNPKPNKKSTRLWFKENMQSGSLYLIIASIKELVPFIVKIHKILEDTSNS